MPVVPETSLFETLKIPHGKNELVLSTDMCAECVSNSGKNVHQTPFIPSLESSGCSDPIQDAHAAEAPRASCTQMGCKFNGE